MQLHLAADTTQAASPPTLTQAVAEESHPDEATTAEEERAMLWAEAKLAVRAICGVSSSTPTTRHHVGTPPATAAAVYKEFPVQQQAFAHLDSLLQQQRHQTPAGNPLRLRVFSMESGAKGQRCFLVASEVEFWRRYSAMAPDKRHVYEIIREGHPCHLYFDLEFDLEANPCVDGPAQVQLLVMEVVALFKERLGVVLDPASHVIELDSTTSSKFSRHLVVRTRRPWAHGGHVHAFVALLLGRLGQRAEQERAEQQRRQEEGERTRQQGQGSGVQERQQQEQGSGVQEQRQEQGRGMQEQRQEQGSGEQEQQQQHACGGQQGQGRGVEPEPEQQQGSSEGAPARGDVSDLPRQDSGGGSVAAAAAGRALEGAGAGGGAGEAAFPGGAQRSLAPLVPGASYGAFFVRKKSKQPQQTEQGQVQGGLVEEHVAGQAGAAGGGNGALAAQQAAERGQGWSTVADEPAAGVAEASGDEMQLMIDTGVYTRNRAFRVFLSSKFGKPHAVLRATRRYSTSTLLAQHQHSTLASLGSSSSKQGSAGRRAPTSAAAPAVASGVHGSASASSARLGASTAAAANTERQHLHHQHSSKRARPHPGPPGGASVPPAVSSAAAPPGLLSLLAQAAQHAQRHCLASPSPLPSPLSSPPPAQQQQQQPPGNISRLSAPQLPPQKQHPHPHQQHQQQAGRAPSAMLSRGEEALIAEQLFFSSLVLDLGGSVGGSVGGGGGVKPLRMYDEGSEEAGRHSGIIRLPQLAGPTSTGGSGSSAHLTTAPPQPALQRGPAHPQAAFAAGRPRAPFTPGVTPWPALNQFVERLCAHTGQPGSVGSWAKVEEDGGAACSLTLRIKSCRWCARLQRHHRSNGVFVVVDVAAGVYRWGCFDPECVGQLSPAMPLPAEAWDALTCFGKT